FSICGKLGGMDHKTKAQFREPHTPGSKMRATFREPKTPESKTPRGGHMGRFSMGPSSNAPRNSFAPTSSSAAMRRSSSVFGASLHAGAAFKDKRDLSKTKQQMITKIFNFCNGEVSFEDVRQPTRRTFMAMFEYIYAAIHDNYIPPKTVEEQNDEIIRIFKNLGYPVTIKKSTLQSLGAPNSWPHLLGALTWLTELINFYGNISCEEILNNTEAQATALRYLSDAAIAKKFFEVKRDHLPDSEKAALVQEIINAQMPKFKSHYEGYLDINSRMEESRLRYQQLAEEVAALEQEKQTDRCPLLQEEIKAIDADIQNLEQFLADAEATEATLRNSSEDVRRQNEELDTKIADINATIKAKQRQIEEQTQRTGLDSAAIRELAMEKESLIEQIKEMTNELEKYSKFRYNIAPKANSAFLQVQSKYRRLVQRVYDVRATYLSDAATPLIDSIPTDVNSLSQSLASDVRKLFFTTKTQLEAQLKELEKTMRSLAVDERLLHDDDARVEKENRAEAIAMEKEERARVMEREEWERESNLKEREMQAAEVEKDTILGSQKEMSNLKQEIHEAELDLDEARSACMRKKSEFDAKLETRVFAQIELHENVIQPRRKFIEDEVRTLEKFNEERAKKK
ncbi:hypothetical protein PENTCL1PPCAC_13713, partial [Pristionchus entomophagus]